MGVQTHSVEKDVELRVEWSTTCSVGDEMAANGTDRWEPPIKARQVFQSSTTNMTTIIHPCFIHLFVPCFIYILAFDVIFKILGELSK